jgi:hypothetical protein
MFYDMFWPLTHFHLTAPHIFVALEIQLWLLLYTTQMPGITVMNINVLLINTGFLDLIHRPEFYI